MTWGCLWLDRKADQSFLKRQYSLCLLSWGDLEPKQPLYFLAGHLQDKAAGEGSKATLIFPTAPTAPAQTLPLPQHIFGHQGVAACRCGLKSLCSGPPHYPWGVCWGAGKDHHVCIDVQMLILIYSLSLSPFFSFLVSSRWLHHHRYGFLLFPCPPVPFSYWPYAHPALSSWFPLYFCSVLEGNSGMVRRL